MRAWPIISTRTRTPHQHMHPPSPYRVCVDVHHLTLVALPCKQHQIIDRMEKCSGSESDECKVEGSLVGKMLTKDPCEEWPSLCMLCAVRCSQGWLCAPRC